jgi:hypothetical protein
METPFLDVLLQTTEENVHPLNFCVSFPQRKYMKFCSLLAHTHSSRAKLSMNLQKIRGKLVSKLRKEFLTKKHNSLVTITAPWAALVNSCPGQHS